MTNIYIYISYRLTVINKFVAVTILVYPKNTIITLITLINPLNKSDKKHPRHDLNLKKHQLKKWYIYFSQLLKHGLVNEQKN